jgi:hypothetical protein
MKTPKKSKKAAKKELEPKLPVLKSDDGGLEDPPVEDPPPEPELCDHGNVVGECEECNDDGYNNL